MPKHTTVKKFVSLLALSTFLGAMIATALASYSDRGGFVAVAYSNVEYEAAEDRETLGMDEESAIIYPDEGQLQDDATGADEDPNLEGLTDEQLQLYQEMIRSRGSY